METLRMTKMKDFPTDLVDQIDALLYLDKNGSLTSPLPGLAREVLTKCRDLRTALESIRDHKWVGDGTHQQLRSIASSALDGAPNEPRTPSVSDVALVLREARRFVEKDPTRLGPSAMLARITEVLDDLTKASSPLSRPESK
jgi:hypothetical protein